MEMRRYLVQDVDETEAPVRRDKHLKPHAPRHWPFGGNGNRAGCDSRGFRAQHDEKAHLVALRKTVQYVRLVCVG